MHRTNEKNVQTIGNEVSDHTDPLLQNTATMECSKAPECPQPAKNAIRPNTALSGSGHVPQDRTQAHTEPTPTSQASPSAPQRVHVLLQ